MVLFYCHGCLLSNCETRPGDSLTPVVIEDEKFKKIFEKIAGFSIESQEDKRDCLMCNKCMKKLMDCLEFFDRIERHEKDFFPIIRKQNAKLEDNVKVQEDRTDFQAESELESEVEEGKYEIIEDDPFKINEILTFAVPVLLYLVVLAVLNIENNKTERGGEEFKQLFEQKEDFEVPDQTVGSGFSADNSVSDSETETQVRIKKPTTVPDINESDKDKESNNDENQNNKLKEDSVRDKNRVKCNICGSLFAKKYFKLELKSEVIKEEYEMQEASIRNKSDVGKIVLEQELSAGVMNDDESLKFPLLRDNQDINETSKTKILKRTLTGNDDEQDKQSHFSDDALKCQKCGENFKSKKTKMRTKILKCEICSKGFKSYSGLELHKKSIHEKIGHECKICSSKFSQRSDLKFHIDTVHLKLKKFECDRCGQIFHRKGNMQQHFDRHINNPNFKPKSTNTSNSNRPFKCTFKDCEKFFQYKQVMINHQLIHSDARPFTCSVCKKSFKRRDYYKLHQLKCSGKKYSK